jgi:hypothetical protein
MSDAEKAARPVDLPDRRIGALARLGHILAARTDVQNPPAGRRQPPILVAGRTGVEDLDVAPKPLLGAADDRA